MARQYNKSSIYWDNRHKEAELRAASLISIPPIVKQNTVAPDLKLEFFGENIMGASAGSGAITNTRNKAVNSDYFNGGGPNQFENLSTFPLPYETSNGFISISKAIQLIMRAYCGFPVFRNAIEVLVEFSNTPIHLTGGTAKSRKFTKALLDRIGISKLSEQFFREYFLNGQFFAFRFEGRIADSAKEIMGAEEPKKKE